MNPTQQIEDICLDKQWVSPAWAQKVAGQVGADKVLAILEAQPSAGQLGSGRLPYAEYMRSSRWQHMREIALDSAGVNVLFAMVLRD